MHDDKVVISRTPLRVSFVGGGTDMPYFYNKFSGGTISVAIDKYIYVTAKYHNNFKEKYRLNYSETEIVNKINKIKNLRIKEVIKLLKITKPLYINTFADIPTNSGLGSSSSFTVGLINSLSKLENKNFSKRKIAEAAYKIEAKITNNSLGKQDQYIAAFGGMKYIKYSKNRILISSINLSKKKIKFLFNSIILVWTGKNRASINVLKNQKKNIKNNCTNLNLLNKLTKKFLKEIKNKKLNIRIIGKIISDSWHLKKSLGKLITNVYINKIYNKFVHKMSYGGKLLGAGNGGFFLFILNHRNKKKFIRIFKKYEYLTVNLENNGTIIL
jgi:D-glycero-alpha-D-manno-heptose-7-phosphate kinase